MNDNHGLPLLDELAFHQDGLHHYAASGSKAEIFQVTRGGLSVKYRCVYSWSSIE